MLGMAAVCVCPPARTSLISPAFVIVNRNSLLCAAETPTEALKAFRKAAKANDFEAAWAHTAQFETPAEGTEYFKGRVQRVLEMMEKGWDFEALEEKIDGNCAVVVINEAKKAGEDAFDIDPAFLIKQGDTWKVLPEITGWRNAGDFLKDQVPTLEKLKVWYRGRKVELKEAHFNK